MQIRYPNEKTRQMVLNVIKQPVSTDQLILDSTLPDYIVVIVTKNDRRRVDLRSRTHAPTTD